MISVIFDMDGTLLDTQRIWVDAWEYAGRIQGVSGMGGYLPDVCGKNDAGSTKYLVDNFKEKKKKKFKEDASFYVKENEVIAFKKGAREILEFLENNNIKIAIASGTRVKGIEHKLRKLNILDKFSVIVGGMDVQNGKPAPDIFLLAAEKMGADPETCFVFEDSTNGIRAGYAAGMKVFGIADIAPFGNDVKELMFRELNSLDEAIEILKEYIIEVN